MVLVPLVAPTGSQRGLGHKRGGTSSVYLEDHSPANNLCSLGFRSGPFASPASPLALDFSATNCGRLCSWGDWGCPRSTERWAWVSGWGQSLRYIRNVFPLQILVEIVLSHVYCVKGMPGRMWLFYIRCQGVFLKLLAFMLSN